MGIAQPNLGVGYELDAIAATVIGGAVLGGGGGSVGGTIGGVMVLGLIDNLLNLLNVQSYFQQVVKGLIILVAVLARRAGRRAGWRRNDDRGPPYPELASASADRGEQPGSTDPVAGLFVVHSGVAEKRRRVLRPGLWSLSVREEVLDEGREAIQNVDALE